MRNHQHPSQQLLASRLCRIASTAIAVLPLWLVAPPPSLEILPTTASTEASTELAQATRQTSIHRTALIIGNGNYQHVGKLLNPSNDAADIAAALKKLGFEVQLLTDANLQQMEAALTRFNQQLRQGGVGVFYYAGHGVQVEGENYLIPVEAKLDRDLDVRYETVPVGKVLNVMEDAGNAANILMLDACRNNPFKRKWASSSRSVSSGGLAPIQAVKGSYIAYATAPGNIAFDGQGQNGTFTSHLLQHIATPNLSVESLFKRVRQGVAQETNNRQIPWDSSSLIGDFSFNPQRSDPTPVPSPTVPAPSIATAPTSPSPSVTPLPTPSQPPTSGTRTAFVGVPRLVQTVTSNNSARSRGGTYYFTIEVPENAGLGLQKVTIQLTEGADQDLDFDLKRSYAFEGVSYRKKNPQISFKSATYDDETQMVTVIFDTPVRPGTTVTIGLQPFHNPTIGGVYSFDLVAYPTGDAVRPQSLGVGQIMFYMTGP